MERVYGEMPPDSIPWNLSEPPALLVAAVETGKIKPCKTADLGCGAGNYAIWLAQQGFDVTGMDISENAIKLAEQHAKEKEVPCRFVVSDLLGNLSEYHESFDFAYDWELLHHISPEDRPAYIQSVHKILRPKGTYFSVCFSEKDPDFGGEGKFRKTPLGTILYFSSEEELKELFEPFFSILELSTLEIKGKYGPHMVNVVWLERK
ncbi:MAG: class I SAM-dependent methyltransferase [Candidatus Zixiibacteriota bacterium]|nr:MAG: class I SAM-dependent methyltransferase [candidate division Zixibacteria bacterium]